MSGDVRTRRPPDNGLIADFHGTIGNPRQLARRLERQPGLIEHGLFPPELVDLIIAHATATSRLLRLAKVARHRLYWTHRRTMDTRKRIQSVKHLYELEREGESVATPAIAFAGVLFVVISVLRFIASATLAAYYLSS
jgi:hypothetical protein